MNDDPKRQMAGHARPPGLRLGDKRLAVSVTRRIGAKGATIELGDETHCARLEPDEARELARWLTEAAAEVEKVTR